MTGATAVLAALATSPADAAAQSPDFEVVGSTFVAIQTADVETAAAWYESVLGLTEVKRLEAEDGRYFIRLLSNGGLQVELIELRGLPAPPARHLGLFKAGFYVDDIDAAHRWLHDRDVDMDAGIFVDDALRARSFVFRDLEGNRLQVFQACPAECPDTTDRP